MSKKNPHWGMTLDTFLTEEGIRDAAKAEATARVVTWQLTQDIYSKTMGTDIESQDGTARDGDDRPR